MSLDIFQYEFFRNALIAAVLSSIVCGIIGSYIVAKRLVFISGGITHASFGGIGIAYYLGWNPILGATLFALASAFGVEFVTKRSGVREDSAIGMFWSAGMAVGVIFIYLSSGYTPNLMSFLFGSILTVTQTDIWLMAGLAIAVAFIFITFFSLILFTAFDEDYARTKKTPVAFINYLMMGLVTLTIILNIRVAGVILVISLLTVPQMTAQVFSHSFKTMIIYSIVIALIGSLSGLYISYLVNLPSGPAIIGVFVILFILVKAIHMVYHKVLLHNKLKT